MDKFEQAEDRRRRALRLMRSTKGCQLKLIAQDSGMAKASVYKMLVGMEDRGEARRERIGRAVYWMAVAQRTTPARTFKRVLQNNLPDRKVRVKIRKAVQRGPVVRLFGGLGF